jgi:hypothetical protein
MTRFRTLLLLWTIAAAAPLSARDWIVDNSAAPGGDGSAGAPLQSLAAAQEASAPGDAIVLRPGRGPYTEGIVLKEAQSLTAAEGRPVIANPGGAGIVLAPVTTVSGVSIRATSHPAIRGRELGEVTLRDVEIDGGETGVLLEGAAGTVTITGGSIRNVQRRGISASGMAGLVVRNVVFEKTPAANGSGCGDVSSSADHVKCTAAVHLQDAADVVLDAIRVTGSEQGAIVGDTVRGFTLSGSELTGSGDEAGESAIQLRNVTGDVRIVNSRIHESAARQLTIRNDTGEARIEIRESSLGGSRPPHGQQGILLTAGGDAKVTLVAEKTTIAGNYSNAIHVIGGGTASLDVAVTNGTFRDNAAAVLLAPAEGASLAYRIDDNVATGNTSSAINVHTTSKALVSGSIARNTIGARGKTNSGAFCNNGGCSGIMVTALGRGIVFADIAGNTIQQAELGIRVRGGDTSDVRARITGNTLREPAGTTPRAAVNVQAGMRPTDTSSLCADVSGNVVEGSWNAAAGGAAIHFLRRFANAPLSIAGYAGARNAPKNAATFVATRNRGAAAAADVTGDLTLADACPVPSL